MTNAQRAEERQGYPTFFSRRRARRARRMVGMKMSGGARLLRLAVEAGRMSATIPADGSSILEPATRPLLTVSSTSHRARRHFSPLRTDEVLHQIIGRRRRLKLSSTTQPIVLLRPAPASSSSALVAATQPRFCDIVAHARHRRGLPPSCSGPHLRLPMGMRARAGAILAYS